MKEKPDYVIAFKFPNPDDILNFGFDGMNVPFNVLFTMEDEDAWIAFVSKEEDLPTLEKLHTIHYTFSNKFTMFSYGEYEKWLDDHSYTMEPVPEKEVEKLLQMGTSNE